MKSKEFKYLFIYKLILFLLFIPLISLSFKFILNIENIYVLSNEVLLNFIKNPISIMYFIILLFVFSLLFIFDSSFILILLNNKRTSNNIKYDSIIYTSFKKVISLFNKDNYLYIIYNMLVMILFIIDIYLLYKYLIVGIILFITLSYLLSRFIYLFTYFIFDNSSFIVSFNNSFSLSDKNSFKDYLYYTFINLIYLFIYIILLVIFISLFKLFKNIVFLKYLFIVTSVCISFIFISLIMPLNCKLVLYKYIKYTKEALYPLNNIIIYNIKNRLLYIIFQILLLVIIVILNILFINNLLNYNINTYNINNIKITGHRGSPNNAPENTLESFMYASSIGADIIELDLQESKDGIIYVMHDNSLKRTTGLNKNSNDVNFDEISKLNACYNMCDKYPNVKVPTFESVLKWAKDNNIKLNIELKNNNKDPNYEKKIIDLIKKYDLQDYVLTSQDYNILGNILKIDKNINTVYVTRKLDNDISYYKDSHDFSLNYSIINSNIVDKVHANGYSVYAWTVDDPNIIRNMIYIGVDNIITNDIDTAKSVINEMKNDDNIINKLYNFIYE